MSPAGDLTTSADFALHCYGTGEKLPIRMPVLNPCDNPTEQYRMVSGFYSTGDSMAWTISDDQFGQFLQIQAIGQFSPGLLQMLSAQGAVGREHEGLSPKKLLLKRIVALRDSIQAEKGILSESYLLIREAREK
jgi:hypothetical protein